MSATTFLPRALCLVALLSQGCGGLDNHGLLQGTLVGKVLNADREVAEVFVFGAPARHAGVEDDGTFELDEVPAGTFELYVRSTQQQALRRSVTLAIGDVLDLGELEGHSAVRVDLVVRTAADGEGDTKALIVEVMRDPAVVSAGSGAPLWVAPGCYTAVSERDGLTRSTGFCVEEGGDTTLDVSVPSE